MRNASVGRKAGIGRLIGAAAASALMLTASVGCLNYGNYPRANNEFTWHNTRVTAGVLELMEQSLGYVIADDATSQPRLATPPAGEPLAAINLPGGITPEQYRRVAERAYPGVVPLSEARDDLPVYQIARIRLRGGSTRVDVLRPATGLERGVERPVYSAVQLTFEGGSGSWVIVGQRLREIGTIDQPRWVPIEALERAIETDDPSQTETPQDSMQAESGTQE
ncbi:MAG: hypothetical protein AAFR76_04455 [Planctomycetota bacterium]